MEKYLMGMTAGIAVGLIIVAIMKWRTGKFASVAEKAEYLSQRRARMLPALAVIFLSQQAAFFSTLGTNDHRPVTAVKISAWLLLSIVILATLATKGFWLERREVRVGEQLGHRVHGEARRGRRHG